jgi:hypothetical protein
MYTPMVSQPLANLQQCRMVEREDAAGEVAVRIDVGVSQRQTGTDCLVLDIAGPETYC